MLEENQNSLSDDQSDSDGSADQNTKSDSDKNSQTKEEHVPKSVYERTKADLAKWKTSARERENQLREMQNRIAELEKPKEGSDGKNDYKTLYENAKRALEEEKGKTGQLSKSVIYNEKYRVVYAELKKLGLRDEAERILEHEDFTDLEVETTSKGRINVLNAKDWAEEFYSKNQYAFQPKKTVSINGSDGRSAPVKGAQISAHTVVEAEMKYNRTRKEEDKRAFEELRNKYVAQQKASRR